MRSESGTITMKAPAGAGSYQVRFFKAQGATAGNYVPDASVAFTVVVQTNTVTYPDFTTHMYVINEWDGKGNGNTNKDGKVEIEVDAISYTWHADTTMENPFDEEGEIGPSTNAPMIAAALAIRLPSLLNTEELALPVRSTY